MFFRCLERCLFCLDVVQFFKLDDVTIKLCSLQSAVFYCDLDLNAKRITDHLYNSSKIQQELIGAVDKMLSSFYQQLT